MKKLYQSLFISLFLLLPLSHYATIHEVYSYYDGGTLSFRDAVSIAEPCDTIRFQASMSGGNVFFYSEVNIPVSLTILGPAGGHINFIAAAPSIRLLNYLGGAFGGGSFPSPFCCNVIKRVRFLNGNPSGNGGAIYTPGPIKIDSCQFINNQAQNGGAIAYVDLGTGGGLCGMQIRNSVFSANQASQDGGAVLVDGGILSLGESGFINNQAAVQGGAVWYRNLYFNSNRLTALQVSMLHNTAHQGGAIYHENKAYLSSTASLNALAMAFNESYLEGGGIYNQEGKMYVHNSPDIHTNQSLNTSGGAIYSKDDLTIHNSRLYQNEARLDGGAVYVAGVKPHFALTASELSANLAQEQGGAIFLNSDQTTASIIGSELIANQAAYEGGAIYHSALLLEIDSSHFEANECFIAGGAIYWDGYANASLNITQTSLRTNAAIQGKGGAIYMDKAGVFVIAETTFDRNKAAAEGGAIAASGTGGSSFWGGFGGQLENNTFSQNQSVASDGGAIDIKGGVQWNILHNTFSLNSAIFGGAISYGNNLSKVQLINIDHSLVADNTAASIGMDIFQTTGTGTLNSNGSNLLGIIDASGFTPLASDLTGTLSSPLAALLGPLANNGGPAWTHLPMSGSPAIDGGSSSSLSADQRGVPRSGAYDIGSVEIAAGAPRLSAVQVSTLELWPNPTQSSFQIRLSEAYEQSVRLRLYNSAGQVVYQGELAAGDTEAKISALRKQPSGIYLLELWGPWERETLRINKY
ncbi:MAG: choice-of-anchor Q domain-containing protein [Bacteroidota bacterium]